MNPQEKSLLIAQSQVVLHMAERLVMLQASFEAFARDQLEDRLEAHFATRQKMILADFSGTTTVLLNTLKQAIQEAATTSPN